MNYSTVTLDIDPTGHFKNPSRCLELVGLIPSWAMTYNPNLGTLREHFVSEYRFPISYDDTGKADDTGVYNYPDDPLLYPIGKFECQLTGDICYVYEYGLVSFFEFDDQKACKQFHTRMD